MKIFFTLLISILTLNIFANTSQSLKSAEMQIEIENDYLLMPIKGAQHYGNFTLSDKDGNVIFKTDALLADSDSKADWYAPINVSAYKEDTLTLSYASPSGDIVKPLQSDSVGIRNYENDRARPAYHLTAKNGWLGNPCGFVRKNNKWHAFYLYNPFAMNNKPPYYIAHAVSDDLINWSYESMMLSPTFGENGDYPVGASLFYDKSNKSNLFDSAKGGVIFLVKYNSGKTSVIISKDLINFTVYNENLKLPNGDNASIANLFYDDSTSLWTIVRSEKMAGENSVAIYTSKDMVLWENSDIVNVDFQTPILKKFNFTGAILSPKYVLWSGDGRYLVGDFKDSKFKKISPEPLRIFFGDVVDATFWQNLDSGVDMVSAMIKQPGDLMRAVGQTFSQSMSMPWNLRLIDSSLGFQLRADIFDSLKSHYGSASDALGLPSMGFESNEFSLPDAVGNEFVIFATSDIRRASAFSFTAGVAKFSYSKGGQGYVISRIDQVRYADKAQVPLDDTVNLMMFVDTYSVETYISDGSAVLFAGDSFINPEQEIKVSATGLIDVKKVLRVPIIKHTQSAAKKAAEDLIDLTTNKSK